MGWGELVIPYYQKRQERVTAMTNKGDNMEFGPNLTKQVEEALGDAMFCTRVWDAWAVGTMTEEDFVLAADNPEFVASIVSLIMRQGESISYWGDNRVSAGAWSL